jgi:hypothetical protein
MIFRLTFEPKTFETTHLSVLTARNEKCILKFNVCVWQPSQLHPNQVMAIITFLPAAAARCEVLQ